MKILYTITLSLIFSTLAFAQPSPKKETAVLLGFPTTQFLFSIKNHSASDFVANHFVTSQTIGDNGEVLKESFLLQNSFSLKLKNINHGTVSYDFIGRSNYGDIYVITFRLPSGSIEHVPVIFKGDLISISRGDLRFSLNIKN